MAAEEQATSKTRSGYPDARTKAERPTVKHYRFISAAMAVSALLVCVDPASANGIDLAVYTGRFNNLDQNLGSYMRWDVAYGDVPTSFPLTQYAPVELDFRVPELTSYFWYTGAPLPWPARDIGTRCGSYSFDPPTVCDGLAQAGFGPVYSQWIFVDIYYPGVQSFEFHFTDPAAPGALAPARFSLVETNYLLDGTLVGNSQGFSLTVNSDGTIQDVVVSNMTLTGPGVGGGPGSEVPEPPTWLLVAIGLAAMTVIYRRTLETRRRRASC
jgi:hypothetical protein